MGNVTIDGLPPATVANDPDLLEVSQSGASRKMSRALLLAGTALSGAIGTSGLQMSVGILGRTIGGTGAIQVLDAAAGRTALALGNVDNTSDANKPVSTAQQTALNGKAATIHAHAIADVTDLQTALDGKAATSHTHTSKDIPVTFYQAVATGSSNAIIVLRPVSQMNTSNTRVFVNGAARSISSFADDPFNPGASTWINLVSSYTTGSTLEVAEVIPNWGIRDIPVTNRTAAYTAAPSDIGGAIRITTGGVTVPANVFAVGQAFSILNNSASNQTITQGSGVTLRQAGTATTGNRTLAQYGQCTVYCVASNEFIISGPGLS